MTIKRQNDLLTKWSCQTSHLTPNGSVLKRAGQMVALCLSLHVFLFLLVFFPQFDQSKISQSIRISGYSLRMDGANCKIKAKDRLKSQNRIVEVRQIRHK